MPDTDTLPLNPLPSSLSIARDFGIGEGTGEPETLHPSRRSWDRFVIDEKQAGFARPVMPGLSPSRQTLRFGADSLKSGTMPVIVVDVRQRYWSWCDRRDVGNEILQRVKET